MINGVSAASESSARIRSPMEFPWLLYWISFKFVTLSGTMLIAGRYESSRFKRSSFIIRRVASIQRIHVQLPSPRISALLSVYHIPFASLRDHQLALVTIVAKQRGTVSTIFTVQRFLLVARVPSAAKKNKCL